MEKELGAGPLTNACLEPFVGYERLCMVERRSRNYAA